MIIINWRIEIYSKTFRQLRKSFDKFGTLNNYRGRYYGSEKLRELHIEAYEEYKRTVKFLGDNQTFLDTKTYNVAVDLNFEIGKKFTEFDTYIKQVKKIEDEIETDYSPDLANRDLPRETELLKKQFRDFADLIKEKEKFKISNKN